MGSDADDAESWIGGRCCGGAESCDAAARRHCNNQGGSLGLCRYILSVVMPTMLGVGLGADVIVEPKVVTLPPGGSATNKVGF